MPEIRQASPGHDSTSPPLWTSDGRRHTVVLAIINRVCVALSRRGRGTALRLSAVTMGTVATVLLLSGAPSWAADVAVKDGVLVFSATEEVHDVVDIRPTGFGYEIYDARDQLSPGLGCINRTRRLVYCTPFVLRVQVDAGPGNDLVGLWDVEIPARINGGDGDDLLESGRGPDTLEGGRGEDALMAADGDDLLVGDEGDDLLTGRDGSDTLTAGPGADVLEGQEGNLDILHGGLGRDLLRGGKGDDQLDGEDGDDVLIGGPGSDLLDTGRGANQVFGIDGQRDTFDCGSRDRVLGEVVERPTECMRRGPRIRIPTRWPPATSSARPASLPDPDPVITVEPRRRGHARRLSVMIPGPYEPKVLVKVRTYKKKSSRPLKRIKVVVHTKGDTVRDPSPGRKAFRARGRFRGSPW
jgi:RTX calcium-binding nonapeptide repeat (4 copies)